MEHCYGYYYVRFIPISDRSLSWNSAGEIYRLLDILNNGFMIEPEGKEFIFHRSSTPSRQKLSFVPPRLHPPPPCRAEAAAAAAAVCELFIPYVAHSGLIMICFGGGGREILCHANQMRASGGVDSVELKIITCVMAGSVATKPLVGSSAKVPT